MSFRCFSFCRTVAWNTIKPGTSPFVAALTQIGIPGAALIMNMVVLTGRAVLPELRPLCNFACAVCAGRPWRCTADTGRPQPPQSAGTLYSYRNRIWLRRADRVGAFANRGFFIPGECFRRGDAHSLFHHWRRPDSPSQHPDVCRDCCSPGKNLAVSLAQLCDPGERSLRC